MEKTLGERLREERDRLGINQTEMADVGGVARNSQGNYERGVKNPDVAYLLAIAKVGVDVMYVLFGSRNAGAETCTAAENDVLFGFRSLGPADQAVVQRIVSGLVDMAAKEAQTELPLD